MSLRTKFLMFGTACCLLFMAGPCAFAEQQTIRIGVMLCLSGDCAEWGTSGLKGAQLAVHELNAAGGLLEKTVELAVQDSRDTTPSHSVNAFHKLAQDPLVRFIVGPTWTVGGMPIAPLIARRAADLIVMSPSVGVKEFNEAAENIFNVWPHDEAATRALARYARSQGWRRAGILGSQDPFYATQSKIFAEEFRKLGGEITGIEEPLPDSRELKAECLRLKKSSPDVIVMTNYQADVIAKELRAIQFANPILALQMERERVREANGALEGVVFAMFDKAADDFRDRYKKHYNSESGISSDTAYDAVMVYARAVRACGSEETACVKKTLFDTAEFHGASGTFSFDSLGAVNKRPVLWRVKALDFERVI